GEATAHGEAPDRTVRRARGDGRPGRWTVSPRRAARGILALAALALGLATPLSAQTWAIRGGTVHTLAGGEPFVGTVLIRDGRIVEVGPEVAVPAGAEVVEAEGMQVYPGLFD